MKLWFPGERARRDARLFETVASLLDAGLQPRVVFTQAGVRRVLTSAESHSIDRVFARGGSVADALADADFAPDAVSRVRASEMAGRLAAGLRSLAAELDRSALAVRRALSRLAYPVFVLHFAALTRGITTPHGGLFTGNNLRGIAAMLALAIPVDAALLLLYLTYRSVAKGGSAAEWVVKIPGLKHLLRDANSLPFLRILADLHDSGVPLDKSVTMAIENRPRSFREPLDGVARDVRAGEALVPALSKTDLFDETTLSILHPAEVSGTLTEGLTRAANVVEQRLDESLKVASRIPGGVCYALAVGVVLWTLLNFYRLELPQGF